MNTPNVPTTTGNRTGRARRTLGQLWQVPTFLAGLFAFAAVAFSAPWRNSPERADFDDSLAALRQAVERALPADRLASLADQVLVRMQKYPDREAEARFLLGSASYRQALAKPTKEAAARIVDQLEQALLLGVSERDRFPLQYRLGWALYQQDKDLPRAIELIAASVDKSGEPALAGHQLLLQAYLQPPTPNLDGAEAAIQKLLDLTPDQEIDALAKVRLAYSDVLTRKGQRLDALKELDRVGPKVSKDLRLKARWMQAKVCAEEGLWGRAIPAWEDLLADASTVPGGKGRVHYELGICHQHREPPNVVEAKRHWTKALEIGGEAGQAAGLRLGELRLLAGNTETDQAFTDWRLALESVKSPDDYRNSYFPLDQVRTMFEQALAHFHENQGHQRAQEVAELYRRLAPVGVAELKWAQAAEAHAKQLQGKAKESATTVPTEQVLAQFKRAGEAHEQAAQVVKGPERSSALWSSIRCFLAAKETAKSAILLKQFSELGAEEAQLAEGWYLVGELLRAAGQKDQAVAAYQSCIQFPATPFAARARYHLAIDAIDRKKLEEAREILQQNLNATGDAIDRESHEKSMYKMALLLVDLREYAAASVYLQSALTQYENNPLALHSREQWGEALRKLAEDDWKEEQKLRVASVVNETAAGQAARLATMQDHRRKRLANLADAQKQYQKLLDELENRSRVQILDERSRELQRRGQLGIAECLIFMEEYTQALRQFQTIQQQHREHAITLVACHRVTFLLAGVLRSLDPAKTEEIDTICKQSVRMALEDLPKITDARFFAGPGVWPRERWEMELRGQLQRLEAPRPPAPPTALEREP
jgi:predicted negative regulator of RcsB-dependent stress response